MNKSSLKNKIFAAMICATPFLASAHGDVTPQSIDTSTIPQLGTEWEETNPYRDQTGKMLDEITRIGSSAYTQNCARCHGLEGISGGIAPDLRMLPADYDGDEWFVYRVQNGAVRNGAVYMPKMSEHLSQEALWAIRTWLESVSVAE
ncbi:cytochrome c-550 PedF [Alteromonadales bacterium alter-6D02]|nr:cytochrome c-550 PedF [Alteromonadales bacterium alter-6D02]